MSQLGLFAAPPPPEQARSRRGGKRLRSGRKPTGRFGRDRRGRPRAGVEHHPRQGIASRVPLHVTVRTLYRVPALRNRGIGGAMGEVLKRRAQRVLACRVVHFTILADHVHLIVEAHDGETLARGMQGLLSGLARVINRASGCSGKVWSDRYHARPLRTPTEVRHCLVYVLRNGVKHGASGQPIDRFSSAAWFDGFAGLGALRRDLAPVHPPACWLLRVGWRSAGGPIRAGERPRTAPAPR